MAIALVEAQTSIHNVESVAYVATIADNAAKDSMERRWLVPLLMLHLLRCVWIVGVGDAIQTQIIGFFPVDRFMQRFGAHPENA